MKTSFVATIRNEEQMIEGFLRSILKQTKKPNEVIVVDGGSTDKTLSVMSSFPTSSRSAGLRGASKIKSSSLKFKVLQKSGNRSVGRNYGIKHATGDIILVSDAGCLLDRNWVKNITEPFENKQVDVVSGYYRPVTKNVFEKSLATYTCAMPDKINAKDFLPSSRSIAFRKLSWKKVGGYPEYLNTCEDLVLAEKMKQTGMKFVFAKSAFVYWRQRKDIIAAFTQFFNYAEGDGRAHYFRPQTPILFLRMLLIFLFLYLYVTSRNPVLLAIMIGGGVAYITWSIAKNFPYIKDNRAFYILPLLQIVSDLAVVTGMTIGFVHSLWGTQERR